MTQHAERRAAPTLLANRGAGGAGTQSLLDLMYEGFYALYLLKNGSGPQDPAVFGDTISGFLAEVDRQAKALGAPIDDVYAARYAFCAAVDEIILRSSYMAREGWQTRPLQLRLFGDQLAGEHFFTKLEDLRTRGAPHLQALEVFHMCLLMGFQGRYAINGDEKLKFMSTTLGNEIARMRGRTRAFAPHAERPDQVANKLRSDLSLWVLTAVFALAGLGGYIGLRASLAHSTNDALAGYNDMIKLPPRAASVTITLP
ncbi:type IVB secretion system protein IcmH/DotU [Massilia sp. DWR3-1-1]|uniref:type IVB secretion system protein IcmH/DotU n=1 Tax=Massilia sp. DWR3-1-1 TaxID=2804559 RepID=UPI003CEA767A